MAGTATVLTDNSRLSRLDQGLHKIELLLALLSGLTVFGLMLLAVISVGGRNFFNQPLPGYVDWIQQAMPLIAFMGISYTQRNGGHVRMDMVVGALKGRPLYVAELITTTAMFLFIVLMVWGTWAHFQRSFDFAAPLWSRDSSMDISLPLWPAKLLAPVAFGVLTLRLALQIVGYGRAIATGTAHPVAVPLPLDMAAQAAMEAEHVSGKDD
ncbi:TRAP transporter small permease subunit [Celeribacter neptunius]|uniref:TRAP transporter small permease protein n=1 Tax=Celeribacter neptunius TaxID=588602 RepID=A0A1I3VQ52_9RHOB|nr:TRAP transporter small permease [Celeribacter neptunius]SFJ97282.1 TRAP-type mannitol/chloroaromatic compound transport system, small permease component [Celeribacter neptunius]